MLEESIRSDTALVSVMAVNNEIGVLQPIQEIGKICRGKSVFFHTDAAQACGKIPLHVNKINVSSLTKVVISFLITNRFLLVQIIWFFLS